MWEAALGTVGAGLVGSIINRDSQRDTNYQNALQAERSNAFNAEQSAQQMAFQERMSSTSHQREVHDLKQAGLNPILSATSQGASSPGGAAASAATPTAIAPQINMPDFFPYMVSMKQLEQADQRLAIDKANSAAGISKSLSEEELNKAEKILKQKGMIRAELEGEASDILKKFIKYMKESVQKPSLRYTPETPEQSKQKWDDYRQQQRTLP